MVLAVTAGPVRMCVGCRGRGIRSQLLRFVAVHSSDGFVLALDSQRSMPGRGAWLHPDLDCLDLAVRRRAFGRALRVALFLDPVEVRAQVARVV
ncbi:MAG: YlxR family protein [Dermatophilaceae bacterium]